MRGIGQSVLQFLEKRLYIRRVLKAAVFIERSARFNYRLDGSENLHEPVTKLPLRPRWIWVDLYAVRHFGRGRIENGEVREPTRAAGTRWDNNLGGVLYDGLLTRRATNGLWHDSTLKA